MNLAQSDTITPYPAFEKRVIFYCHYRTNGNARKAGDLYTLLRDNKIIAKQEQVNCSTVCLIVCATAEIDIIPDTGSPQIENLRFMWQFIKDNIFVGKRLVTDNVELATRFWELWDELINEDVWKFWQYASYAANEFYPAPRVAVPDEDLTEAEKKIQPSSKNESRSAKRSASGLKKSRKDSSVRGANSS